MVFSARNLFDALRRRLDKRTGKMPLDRRKSNWSRLRLVALEDRLTPALTPIQSYTFGPTPTDWTANFGSFNRFDPSRGSLNSVIVTETASSNQSANITKLVSLSETVSLRT